jgi:hypothetical protein
MNHQLSLFRRHREGWRGQKNAESSFRLVETDGRVLEAVDVVDELLLRQLLVVFRKAGREESRRLVVTSARTMRGLRLVDQGPMLWFFKYFRRKIQWSNWRFWLKTKLNYAKHLIMTLVFEKNAYFFAENCQKSQKIVILTSVPGQGDQIGQIFVKWISARWVIVCFGQFFWKLQK